MFGKLPEWEKNVITGECFFFFLTSFALTLCSILLVLIEPQLNRKSWKSGSKTFALDGSAYGLFRGSLLHWGLWKFSNSRDYILGVSEPLGAHTVFIQVCIFLAERAARVPESHNHCKSQDDKQMPQGGHCCGRLEKNPKPHSRKSSVWDLNFSLS